MEGVVNTDANALLAISEAEGSAKSNFFAEVVFGNQILKLLYYLT